MHALTATPTPFSSSATLVPQEPKQNYTEGYKQQGQPSFSLAQLPSAAAPMHEFKQPSKSREIQFRSTNSGNKNLRKQRETKFPKGAKWERQKRNANHQRIEEHQPRERARSKGTKSSGKGKVVGQDPKRANPQKKNKGSKKTEMALLINGTMTIAIPSRA